MNLIDIILISNKKGKAKLKVTSKKPTLQVTQRIMFNNYRSIIKEFQDCFIIVSCSLLY